MSDKYFIDTNILIYAYSLDEPDKRKVAENLIFSNHNKALLSTQVINEFINAMLKKKKIEHKQLYQVVEELLDVFMVLFISDETIKNALRIASKYHYSYYDSLMISSAIESKCSILFSEDMHDSHMIEDVLTIKNPFAKTKT